MLKPLTVALPIVIDPTLVTTAPVLICNQLFDAVPCPPAPIVKPEPPIFHSDGDPLTNALLLTE